MFSDDRAILYIRGQDAGDGSKQISLDSFVFGGKDRTLILHDKLITT